MFWGDAAGGLAIHRESQWKDTGQHVGRDSHGASVVSQPPTHAWEQTTSCGAFPVLSPWGILVCHPGCPALILSRTVVVSSAQAQPAHVFAEQHSELLRACRQGPKTAPAN